MIPVDNIIPFARVAQAGPNAGGDASPPVPSSDTTSRRRSNAEYHKLWAEWERSAPPRGCEMRGIAVARLRDCLAQRNVDLYLSGLDLSSLPELPPHIRKLNINYNNLRELPELPSDLRCIYACYNKLETMPYLPNSIELLNIEGNRLKKFDGKLPSRLKTFYCSNNQLEYLPSIPSCAEFLYVDGNQIKELPEDLPCGLVYISCSNNRLTRLPESITRLPSDGLIYVDGNPLSERTIQSLLNLSADPNYRGPRVHFSVEAGSGAETPARSLEEAVAAWFPPESEIETAEIWAAIATEEGAEAFSKFLDRLANTVSAQKVPGFTEQVAAWLTRMSASPVLREATFALAVPSCEGRIASVWSGMQRVELAHRAESSACDDLLPEVIAAGLETFRLEELEQIAQGKAKKLRFVDDIEVYLAFQIALRDKLNLSLVAQEMRFFDVGVTQDDVDAAEVAVKTAENETFADWLPLWMPWVKFLDRIAAGCAEQAKELPLKNVNSHYRGRVGEDPETLYLVGDPGAEAPSADK